MVVEAIIKILEERGFKQPTTVLELIENNEILFEVVAQVVDSHVVCKD